MKASPIYLISGAVYRFEQIINNQIELFSSRLQRSIMIDYDESLDRDSLIDYALTHGLFTVTDW